MVDSLFALVELSADKAWDFRDAMEVFVQWCVSTARLKKKERVTVIVLWAELQNMQLCRTSLVLGWDVDGKNILKGPGEYLTLGLTRDNPV